MNMRKSRVLRKLRENKPALSIKLNLSDVRGAELAASFGFDCIWYCMEHTPSDYNVVENIVRAAKIYDVDVVTRTAKGSYSDLIRPLEADSTGIMVPHVMSYEEAKQIVYYTKFHPIGRRPLDGGNTDGFFCNIPIKEYILEANRERFVAIQIEDPEPMAELDRICELEGIDIIFFGPADYSQGIGKPGDTGNPEIEKARRAIAETAKKHGKFAGTVGNLSNLKELIDMGYLFINIGADVVGLSSYYGELKRGMTEVLEGVGK